MGLSFISWETKTPTYSYNYLVENNHLLLENCNPNSTLPQKMYFIVTSKKIEKDCVTVLGRFYFLNLVGDYYTLYTWDTIMFTDFWGTNRWSTY